MDGTLRPIDGHRPHGGTTSETYGMFERDDLLTAQRLRDLHAAAEQVRAAGAAGPGLIDRARRSLGGGLIAIGHAIGGARAATAAAAGSAPCDDCELGAAA